MTHPDCQHTEGTAHDCQTVDFRNRQIPAAERYANSYVATNGELCIHTGAMWVGAFLRRMDELCGTKPVL